MINKTKNLLVIGIIILIGNVTLLYGKIELESLRTSTSKTYLLENGSFQTEIFLYEINYLDEQGMYRTLEDTSVISVYTGSPNEYTYSGSVSYDDGFGMRVGRSDVTKNGSLYQTVTNPIYSDVKYRAYSTWDISGVGDENLVAIWGIRINSLSYSSSLSFHFQNNNWTQTVDMKYGDIIPSSESNAQANYNAIGSALLVTSKSLTGSTSGSWSSESFNHSTNGYSELDQYVRELRINGVSELDILFKASNESSNFTFDSDTVEYWDYSVGITPYSLIVDWKYENPTLYMANEWNNTNLNTTDLYLKNLTTGEVYDPISSGLNVPVNSGDNYLAETDEQFVNWSGNILQHHHWKPNDGEAITEYQLSHTFTLDSEKMVDIAKFEKIEQVTISTQYLVQLEIQDPWYVNGNGEQLGNEYVDIDPNTYQYQVFLNQNEDFEPDKPTYRLKASKYYGYTKLAIEDMLKWYGELKGLKFAALRYFNAAGYDVNGTLSGLEKNPQNLLPIVMEVASGVRKSMNVFGDDYDTKDGTGIRDYIHVNDLASAHVSALEYLQENDSFTVNLATGEGYSVMDVIKEAEAISGNTINYTIVDRRPGDPAELIATSKQANELMNWEAKNSDLNTILKSMWNVYNPEGKHV